MFARLLGWLIQSDPHPELSRLDLLDEPRNMRGSRI